MSTQHASTLESALIKKTYSSPFAALNVNRRNESVATCTIYGDASAIDDGSKCVQAFVGTKNLVSDVYRMKSDKKILQ